MLDHFQVSWQINHNIYDINYVMHIFRLSAHLLRFDVQSLQIYVSQKSVLWVKNVEIRKSIFDLNGLQNDFSYFLWSAEGNICLLWSAPLRVVWESQLQILTPPPPSFVNGQHQRIIQAHPFFEFILFSRRQSYKRNLVFKRPKFVLNSMMVHYVTSIL